MFARAARLAFILAAVAGPSVPALAQQSDAQAQPPAASTQDVPFRSGLSLMGEPKYKPGFPHFDYVNPQAPTGGLLRMADDGTFDSFNFVVPRGAPASGITLIYDTLMTASNDEVSSEYGLLAEGVRFPEDFSSVTYRLREGAKWHDGQPVTPEDVVWSFEMLTKHNPNQRYYYSHVVKAEKTGDRDVTFTFDQAGNRELPQIVGQIMVLPKHWWTGKDANGKARDIAQGTLEPPLGSGPYRIKTFIPGRSVTYERVADYWGKDLPVNVGRNNLGEIRYEYFRDETVMLEAFKADQYDFRIESSAKNWATAYDFPARKAGDVVLEMFENRATGMMQAFIPNLRREKFQDRRVRRALNLALDFEGMNHTLFFGQYVRVNSFFSGTELASSGLPEGRELEILEEVRKTVPGGLPEEVFTSAFANPSSTDEKARRTNLQQAAALLKEAGYEVKNRKLVNAKGEPFTIEILLNSPAMERAAVFYRPALERLGITVNIRVVDSSQYTNRVRSRDFDMIVSGWAQSLSPGNEQRSFFGSSSADQPGGYNFAGIANPAIDALIDRVIYAKSREDLVASTRALDRALMWNEFVVPAWTLNYTRTARWNRFAHPENMPAYSFAFPDIWWFDAAKAATIRNAPKGNAPQGGAAQ